MKTPQTANEIPTHSFMLDRHTGLPCGPAVPINPQDYPYRSIEGYEILWRYMDYWKLEYMLTKSVLYFARADQLGLSDPFEGRLSEGNREGWSDSDRAFYGVYSIDGTPEAVRKGLEDHRCCTFVSCWHRNTKESRKMWDAYTTNSESVLITTSARRLERFLPEKILKSAVRYHDADFKRSMLFGWNGVLFYKPATYAFEREFRLLSNLAKGESVEMKDPKNLGRALVCPLDRIVLRVITHPRSTDAFRAVVDMLLAKFLKRVRRENSSLPP